MRTHGLKRFASWSLSILLGTSVLLAPLAAEDAHANLKQIQRLRLLCLAHLIFMVALCHGTTHWTAPTLPEA